MATLSNHRAEYTRSKSINEVTNTISAPATGSPDPVEKVHHHQLKRSLIEEIHAHYHTKRTSENIHSTLIGNQKLKRVQSSVDDILVQPKKPSVEDMQSPGKKEKRKSKNDPKSPRVTKQSPCSSSPTSPRSETKLNRRSASRSPRKLTSSRSKIDKPNKDLKKVSTYLDKGEKCMNKGQISKALEQYERALTLNPTSSEAWNKKGFLYHKIGKTEEALQCYEQALRIDPSNALLYNNKGGVFLTLERHEEALGCFVQALERNDGYYVAWNNKGVAMRSLGKLEEAIKCEYRAIQLCPSYRQAWYNLARAKHAHQELTEALVCYDRAIELGDQQYYQAYHGKAMVYRELGKHEEAMACLQKVLQLNPAYEDVWLDVPVVATNGDPKDSGGTAAAGTSIGASMGVSTGEVTNTQTLRFSLEESSTQSKQDVLKQIALDESTFD